MQSLLNQNYQIITGRVSIPAGTPVGTPVSLTLSPQNPILVDIQTHMTGATLSEFGYIIKAGGRQIFPALGSQAGTTFSDSPMWASTPPGLLLDSKEINAQIPGPGYDLEILIFNKSATPAVFFIQARTTPKIDLKSLPIQNDELLKKDDLNL